MPPPALADAAVDHTLLGVLVLLEKPHPAISAARATAATVARALRDMTLERSKYGTFAPDDGY
jgi:hypothetical protein